MNVQPIETAQDADLRAVPLALARAAQRAREIAARTGTSLVVSDAGKVQLLSVSEASFTKYQASDTR